MAAASIPQGVVYPAGGSHGVMGSTDAGRLMIAASYKGTSPSLYDAALNEKKWRENYPHVIAENVHACAKSTEDCVAISTAGLEHMYTQYRFSRGSSLLPFGEGFETARQTPLVTYSTVVVEGAGRLQAPSPGEVGFNYEGKWLTGKAMLKQMQAWATKGTLEQSAVDNLTKVVEAGDAWTNLRDSYFVVMGAGAAMSPTECLLRLGANVIAVDIDIPAVWERLVALAEKSNGRLIIPTSVPVANGAGSSSIAAVAGANLLTHGPEVCNWLCTVCPGETFTVGAYAYMDGTLFVRVALAMDAIAMGVCKARPDSRVAYLCSPTDCFTAPVSAADQGDATYDRLITAAYASPIRMLSGGKFFQKNGFRSTTHAGKPIYIAPEFVMQQGPNYALAKRIQHWRAMLLRSSGHLVSSNVAPASKTVSVMKQSLLAAAYSGAEYFHPIEVFPPEVSNNLMTYLMLHDITAPDAVANPMTPIDNPGDIFMDNACHNGFWRCAFVLRSLVEVAAVVGMADPYMVPAVGALGLAGAFFAKSKL